MRTDVFGPAMAAFLDGLAVGLWWVRDGCVVWEVFTQLSKREQSELDAEVAAVEELPLVSAKPRAAWPGNACSAGRTACRPGGEAAGCVPSGERT